MPGHLADTDGAPTRCQALYWSGEIGGKEAVNKIKEQDDVTLHRLHRKYSSGNWRMGVG